MDSMLLALYIHAHPTPHEPRPQTCLSFPLSQAQEGQPLPSLCLVTYLLRPMISMLGSSPNFIYSSILTPHFPILGFR